MDDVHKSDLHIGGVGYRKQNEEKLNDFTRALFNGNLHLLPFMENAPLAIVITDGDGKIKYINPGTERIFGYKFEELHDNRIENLLPEHLRYKHIGHRKGFNDNPYTRPMGIGLDLMGRRKSGEEFPVEIGLSQLIFQDKPHVICYITDISERKRTEQELVESEKRFRTLIDAAPDAVILLNQEGVINQVNKTSEEIFKFSQDDLIGQSADILFSASNYQNQFKERLAYAYQPENQQVGNGFEISATRKDGYEFPVEIKLSPFKLKHETMVIAIVRDITERKQTERELMLLGQIAQQMKEAVILTYNDPSSTILYVNDAFTDLYGYTQEEVIGKPSWILFAGDNAEQKTIEEKRDNAVDLQGKFEVEYQDRRKDGSLFWVSNTSSVIKLEDGETNYDLGIVRDVTKRVEFQELLGKQNEFLAALHEISLNILSRLDLKDLLESLIWQATRLLNNNHGDIYLVDKVKNELICKVGVGLFSERVGSRIKLGEGFIGNIGETGEPFIVEMAQYDRDCLGVPVPDRIKFVMGAPLVSGDELIGVICVASDDEFSGSFGKRERDMLIHFGQLASISIKNAQLFAEIELSQKEIKLHSARMEKELAMARSVQVAMLPQNFPDVDGWSFGAKWKPALEVSGDFYDLVLRKDKYLDLMIGDVTDKGVPAALFMAQSKALLSSFLESSSSLMEGVVLTNQSLIRENVGPFVTLFLARIDPITGETIYVNAGHSPPLVYRNTENQIIQLESTGIPFGIESNLEYEQRSIKLEKKDFLVLFTDGVTEAMDQNHNQFGVEQLMNTIYHHRDGSAEEIAMGLLSSINDYVGVSKPSDDIAIVVVRRL